MIDITKDTTTPMNEGSANVNGIQQGVGARRRAQRRSSCSAISEYESNINHTDLPKDWMMTNPEKLIIQKEDEDQSLERFNQSFSIAPAFGHSPSLDVETTKSCDNLTPKTKTHRQSRRSSWHAASTVQELPGTIAMDSEDANNSDKVLSNAETVVSIPVAADLTTSDAKKGRSKQSRRSSWHASCPNTPVPKESATQVHQGVSNDYIQKSEKLPSNDHDIVPTAVEQTEIENAVCEPNRRQKQSRRSSWHASSPMMEIPTEATSLVDDQTTQAEVECTVPEEKDEPRRSGKAARRSSWHASTPTSHEVIEHDEVDVAHVQRTIMMIKHIHMGATRRTSLSNSTDMSLGGPTVTESLNTGGRRMNRRSSWAGCGAIASEVSLDNHSNCGSEVTCESLPNSYDEDSNKPSDLPIVVDVGRQRMARRPSKKQQSLDLSCLDQPPQDAKTIDRKNLPSPNSTNLLQTSNGSGRMNRRSSWSGSLPNTSETSLEVDTLRSSGACTPLTPIKKKDPSGSLSADSFATARTYIVDLDDPDTPVEGGRPMTIPLTHSPKSTSVEAGKERRMWGIKNKINRNQKRSNRSTRSHSPKMNDRLFMVSSANMPLSDDEDGDYDQMLSCVQLTCLGDVANCKFADSQVGGLDFAADDSLHV